MSIENGKLEVGDRILTRYVRMSFGPTGGKSDGVVWEPATVVAIYSQEKAGKIADVVEDKTGELRDIMYASEWKWPTN